MTSVIAIAPEAAIGLALVTNTEDSLPPRRIHERFQRDVGLVLSRVLNS
jgi:hypothetical protein